MLTDRQTTDRQHGVDWHWTVLLVFGSVNCHKSLPYGYVGLDTLILFTKGTELTLFGQLKRPMIFSINLNLKTVRLLNCLHMIFLDCILRYLIIL